MKILSIVAIIFFFPTGVPAAYFAWRTKTEFDEGILRGNIDRALKFAKRTERLLILTVISVVLVVVLTLAIIERNKHGYTVEHRWTG